MYMKNRNDEIKTYKKRLIGATGKVIDRNRKKKNISQEELGENVRCF